MSDTLTAILAREKDENDVPKRAVAIGMKTNGEHVYMLHKDEESPEEARARGRDDFGSQVKDWLDIEPSNPSEKSDSKFKKPDSKSKKEEETDEKEEEAYKEKADREGKSDDAPKEKDGKEDDSPPKKKVSLKKEEPDTSYVDVGQSDKEATKTEELEILNNDLINSDAGEGMQKMYDDARKNFRKIRGVKDVKRDIKKEDGTKEEQSGTNARDEGSSETDKDSQDSSDKGSSDKEESDSLLGISTDKEDGTSDSEIGNRRKPTKRSLL